MLSCLAYFFTYSISKTVDYPPDAIFAAVSEVESHFIWTRLRYDRGHKEIAKYQINFQKILLTTFATYMQ
jgi:hypothetical protein